MCELSQDYAVHWSGANFPRSLLLILSGIPSRLAVVAEVQSDAASIVSPNVYLGHVVVTVEQTQDAANKMLKQ